LLCPFASGSIVVTASFVCHQSERRGAPNLPRIFPPQYVSALAARGIDDVPAASNEIVVARPI